VLWEVWPQAGKEVCPGVLDELHPVVLVELAAFGAHAEVATNPGRLPGQGKRSPVKQFLRIVHVTRDLRRVA